VSVLDPVSIDHALARSQIIELLHRYAYLARDHADWDAMVPLFAPDGVFITPFGPVPPTEISKIEMGVDIQFIRHHITTIDIEFVDETHAVAESFYLAVTDLAQPDHWGNWRDELRFDGTRWLLTRKDPNGGKTGWHPDGYLARAMAGMQGPDGAIA
jgi:hypothetical protein